MAKMTRIYQIILLVILIILLYQALFSYSFSSFFSSKLSDQFSVWLLNGCRHRCTSSDVTLLERDNLTIFLCGLSNFSSSSTTFSQFSFRSKDNSELSHYSVLHRISSNFVFFGVWMCRVVLSPVLIPTFHSHKPLLSERKYYNYICIYLLLDKYKNESSLVVFTQSTGSHLRQFMSLIQAVSFFLQ